MTSTLKQFLHILQIRNRTPQWFATATIILITQTHPHLSHGGPVPYSRIEEVIENFQLTEKYDDKLTQLGELSAKLRHFSS